MGVGIVVTGVPGTGRVDVAAGVGEEVKTRVGAQEEGGKRQRWTGWNQYS
jgi:predicted kinase